MMNLTFGLFNQVSDSGPQGPLVLIYYQSHTRKTGEAGNRSYDHWIGNLTCTAAPHN